MRLPTLLPFANPPRARIAEGAPARASLAMTAPLALLSGIAEALAAPGGDVPLLPFLCLLPLFVTQTTRTPGVAALLGFLQAFAFGVVGQRWLVSSAAGFTHLPPALALLFALAVWIEQAGRGALAGWIFARVEARSGSLVLAAVLATTCAELVYPLLFPWYRGVLVHDVLPLAQLGELGGPLLVSAAVTLTNASLASLLLAVVHRRAAAARGAALGLALVAVAIGWGHARIRTIDARVAQAPSLTVGIVQGNAAAGANYETPDDVITRQVALTREAHGRGADLAVWSEASVGYTVPESRAAPFLAGRVARRVPIPSLFGAVLTAAETPSALAVKRNSAVAMTPEGAVTGRYDKHHLLLFGERIPFERWFPWLRALLPNTGNYEEGNRWDPVVVRAAGHDVRAATVICYEALLPSFVNELVRRTSPDVLVALANDVWFGASAEPAQHLALASLRAVEHRRFLVRGANSGVSAVVDPVGRVVASTDLFREEALVARVGLLAEPTVYERLGDGPAWLAVGLTAVVALRGRSTRPRRRGPPSAAPLRGS